MVDKRKPKIKQVTILVSQEILRQKGGHKYNFYIGKIRIDSISAT